MTQLAEGTFTQPSLEKVRISELWEPYLRDKRINGRGTKNSIARWELHLKPSFADTRISSCGTDMLNRYVDQRMQEGAANATINREMAVLQRMFRLGHAATPRKVLSLPHFPHLAENNVRLGFVEFSQYQKMAQLAPTVWMRAMLEVFHTYGWRRREVLSMRVRQVDFVAGVIRLDVGTTKNKEGREAPMTATVRALLTECATGKGPEDYLFTRKNGKPVRDFRKAWRGLCEAAGVPGLLVHDMRRTAVRNLRRAGMDQSVIMTISGHKTSSVFKRYNIVASRDRREALAKLEQTQQSARVGHNEENGEAAGKERVN